MGIRFSDFAFKEVVERPDKGAGWTPLFIFKISGEELSNTRDRKPQINPSLNATPAFDGTSISAPSASQCTLLLIDEMSNDTKVPETHLADNDLYGIFATTAYIATTFNRPTYIFLINDETGDKHLGEIGQADFENATHFKLDALTFYHDMLTHMKIDSPYGRDKTKTITLRLGQIQHRDVA